MSQTVLIVALSLAAVACSSNPTDGDVPATTGFNLDEILLEPDGLGDVFFGANEQEVLDALLPFLGGLDVDTGWIDGRSGIYGSCPATLRVISWGSLSVFFTTPEDVPPRGDETSGTFFAYAYGFDFEEALSGVDPRNLDLATIENIGLGDPGTVLDQLDTDVVFSEDEGRGVLEFAIAPTDDAHLRGTLSGTDRSNPIAFIETSTGCT